LAVGLGEGQGAPRPRAVCDSAATVKLRLSDWGLRLVACMCGVTAGGG
jgi:hypothetical protein